MRAHFQLEYIPNFILPYIDIHKIFVGFFIPVRGNNNIFFIKNVDFMMIIFNFRIYFDHLIYNFSQFHPALSPSTSYATSQTLNIVSR